MKKLTLSQINTGTHEGRYLTAALSKLTVQNPTVTPEEMLDQLHDTAEYIYDGQPVPGEDDTFKVRKTRSGQFRWKRTAPNSRTVGGATEPYHNRTDCLDNARRNGVPPYMIEEAL